MREGAVSGGAQHEATPRIPFWIAAVVVVGVLGAFEWHEAHVRTHSFDDSLMFYRYAVNIRHHLGISWNHDGVHTYGATSLTWLLVILLLSFVPMTPAMLVSTASGVACLAVFAVWTYWLRGHATGGFLQSPGNALLAVAIPLELNFGIMDNACTGMDTMLSLLVNSVVAMVAVRFVAKPTYANAMLAGGVGFLAYATRPEMLLCAVLAPLMLWLLSDGERRVGPVAALLGVEGLLVGASLLWAKAYFHTAVPLAFYVKSQHRYEGYIGYAGPAEYLFLFLSFAAVYLLVIVALARREDLPLLIAFGVPVALTTVYLSTVTQIMGFGARYYIPLLPFLMLPAMRIVDRAMKEKTQFTVGMPGWRAVAVGMVLFATLYSCGGHFAKGVESAAAGRLKGVPQPRLVYAATRPLPETDQYVLIAVTRDIVEKLPLGASMAASEVGYAGAYAPDLDVIDLVGLNDREFAMNGFSMDSLMLRKPDVIWMPHPHYTGMIATILQDPRLLEQYRFYTGAYNFGVAVRKDSANGEIALRNMQDAWNRTYPGTTMEDYRVQAVVPAGPTL